ncbi:hypothetical protein CPB84DRAFT_1143792 [Gymnopilus junonius]|uniref:Gamma-glutamylcyclotransferase AIG2-like domain-containing protein n=1 Tax=Gymnopilus junonius TaxID=109634 RepID=A0A9P5NLT0_GYMJU|nr:hypothetical protein CPB84DRAFT_1143792 [Gymnopilus junonius]
MAENMTPRPLFLYGTLRALPLLAWAITGDPKNVDHVRSLTHPSLLRGFFRTSIAGKDFPALIRRRSYLIDGLLLRPQTDLQRRKIHEFMGRSYKVVRGSAFIEMEGVKVKVDADVYLWMGEPELLYLPWDLEVFEREKLEGWLEIYSKMRLIW